MDDHGAHHYHHGVTRDDLSVASTAPDEDEEEGDDDDTTSSGESVEEVRFGVRNTRDVQDVEANLPELIKEKSARSIKDPNLASFFPPLGNATLTALLDH